MRPGPTRLAALLLAALVGHALPAAALPRVLLCIDDGGDGSGAIWQKNLEGTKLFATVDLMDCSTETPALMDLKTKMYDAVLTWGSLSYADSNALGDTLADYVDLGGGVVQAMNNFGGQFGTPLQGRWAKDGYDCILPNGLNGELFQPSALTAMPNEASPLTAGVGGLTDSLRGDGTLNVMNGAKSAWDYADKAPGVCHMAINGHQRVDLNASFADNFGQPNYSEKNPGDATKLVANALAFVAGGFNPLRGMPNPVSFPNTGTFALSPAQTVTFTNSSMVMQTITNIAIAGANPGDFQIAKAPAVPLQVAPMGTVSVDVLFAPQVAGPRSGSLSVAVTGQMFNAEVSLGGTALPSSIAVSPNPLAFGGTQANMPITKSVTIANKGAGKISVTGVSVTAGGPVFAAGGLPGLPISLANGGSFQVMVTFTPTMGGTFMGTLGIASTDPNNAMMVVPLSGCAGPSGITLDAASLAFGDVNIGGSSPQDLHVTNSGCADLKVSDVTVGGQNAGDFLIDKAALVKNAVTAGSSQPFTVTFKPTAAGMRSATVTVVSDAGNKVITVLGNGTTAMGKVAPGTLAFGNQALMMASMPQNLTVSNTGTGVLHLLGMTFGGKDAASFSLSGMAPATVAANGMAMVGVLCTPTAAGALAGTLTIATDVGNLGPVTLTCTGVTPMISVAPTSLDFGPVSIGATSMAMAVTITNSGSDTLNVTDVLVAGQDQNDFTITDPPAGPMALKPKDTLVFHVAFAPQQDAMEMAEVDISSDDPMMGTAVVKLMGSGAQANLAVSDMTLDFGGVPTESKAQKSLTLSNTGDLPVKITSIIAGGAFTVDSAGGQTLKPNDMVALNVTFSPIANGAQMSTLTITPEQPAMPITVTLKGSGIGPMVTVTPNSGGGSLDFGPVMVGATSAPQTVTIANGGGVAVQLQAIMPPDPAFTVDQSATMMMLAPNQSTTFTVTFAPTAAQAYSGPIIITAMGHTKPVATLGVTGSGVEKKPSGGGCTVGHTPDGGRALTLGAALLLAALLLRRRRSN